MQAVATARSAMVRHCMCAKVSETQSHVTVIFPPGYTLDGVRVTLENGKAWAYTKAAEKMEQIWSRA